MKVDLFTVIESQYSDLSPEVVKAQRMAELEQIAKYRATKLQYYKDWADPVKRAAWIARADQEQKAARNAIEEADLQPKVRDFVRLDDRITVTLLNKVSPKQPWWRRLMDWFK